MRAIVRVWSIVFIAILSPAVLADDISDVTAAELAFNAAQNRGDTVEMFSLLLPDRTIYGPGGSRLFEGWTEESRKNRQAQFDRGRKISYKIEDLNVRIFGDTAITTFRRVGTIQDPDGTVQPSKLLITGVWLRQGNSWKLAHRHESNY